MQILFENKWLLSMALVVGFGLLILILLFIGFLSAYTKAEPSDKVPISVVMAVKNEARIIADNLKAWFNILPKDSDLVVADDQSWDKTPEILEKLQVQHPSLHVVYLKEDTVKLSGKKFALTMGIKGAKHDAVLLTDADCQPASEQTTGLYAERFAKGYSMVLGHSPVLGGKGFTGLIQSLEALQSGIHYTGLSSLGVYYMGIGRSLAYSRSTFLDLGGFKMLYKLPYGDDDLFVQRYSKSFKKSLLLNPKAFINTQALEKFSAYWNQKRRHLSAGTKYAFKHKIVLSIFPMVHVISLAILNIGLFIWPLHAMEFKLLAAIFGLKFLVELIIYSIMGKKLAYGYKGLGLVFWQYISPFFNAAVWLSIKLKPVSIWMK